ncbi:putative glutamate carboxypeptidase 2 [Platanthera guangdongensis]|uniref:Glutamate carboxypeptidase 2 n=1 Tax=Platanthera guangdongensis TaxID=2320717 RepID=A0ABR2LU60_9ASPA
MAEGFAGVLKSFRVVGNGFLTKVEVMEQLERDLVNTLEEEQIVKNVIIGREKVAINVFHMPIIMKGYEEPDHYVILGSHRYSWTYGVVDRNNGAFILLDVSRHLGAFLCYRWSPMKTIILCSWDAEEFGMDRVLRKHKSLFIMFFVTSSSNSISKDHTGGFLNEELELVLRSHYRALYLQAFDVIVNCSGLEDEQQPKVALQLLHVTSLMDSGCCFGATQISIEDIAKKYWVSHIGDSDVRRIYAQRSMIARLLFFLNSFVRHGSPP